MYELSELSLHTTECIKEMQLAVDKLLGARQLVDSDNTIPSNEKERLLHQVDKAINTFRKRMEAALPAGRNLSDMSASNTSSSVTGQTSAR